MPEWYRGTRDSTGNVRPLTNRPRQHPNLPREPTRLQRCNAARLRRPFHSLQAGPVGVGGGQSTIAHQSIDNCRPKTNTW